MKRTYSAEEAANRLGISRATLYAYVSRGLLRSLPGEGPTRARRYPQSDVDALKRKRTEGREPAAVAMHALAWGQPVLDSRITSIANNTLRYRGRDAVELAERSTFERVAALLICGDEDEPLRLEPLPGIRASGSRGGGIARAIEALARARDSDGEAESPDADARLRVAGRTIGTIVAAIAGGRAETRVAVRLAKHFELADAFATPIDRALVLVADHELNVSSFVARCVASARGTPYDAAIAALCAFRGPRHGAAVLALFRFVESVGNERKASRILRHFHDWSARRQGFEQPLYPNGDPRTSPMLDALSGLVDAERLGHITRIREVIEDAEGLHPTIDYALAAFAYTAGLPAPAAMEVFATGRSAGWMAHVMEQYTEPGLIRPRARVE